VKTVRTKSIPNVPDERLIGDIDTLHKQFHTAEGLHAHDKPRRDLIDNGNRIKKISAELHKRGIPHPIPGCQFCQRCTCTNCIPKDV
jgi:hypothetical protein